MKTELKNLMVREIKDTLKVLGSAPQIPVGLVTIIDQSKELETDPVVLAFKFETPAEIVRHRFKSGAGIFNLSQALWEHHRRPFAVKLGDHVLHELLDEAGVGNHSIAGITAEEDREVGNVALLCYWIVPPSLVCFVSVELERNLLFLPDSLA